MWIIVAYIFYLIYKRISYGYIDGLIGCYPKEKREFTIYRDIIIVNKYY